MDDELERERKDEELEELLLRLDEIQELAEETLEEIAKARFEVGALALRREQAAELDLC